MKLCRLVEYNRCFEGIYCFHLLFDFYMLAYSPGLLFCPKNVNKEYMFIRLWDIPANVGKLLPGCFPSHPSNALRRHRYGNLKYLKGTVLHRDKCTFRVRITA
jgi:hypothetical protein